MNMRQPCAWRRECSLSNVYARACVRAGGRVRSREEAVDRRVGVGSSVGVLNVSVGVLNVSVHSML